MALPTNCVPLIVDAFYTRGQVPFSLNNPQLLPPPLSLKNVAPSFLELCFFFLPNAAARINEAVALN